MVGAFRRGGRGSNQYSVKPPTVRDEDAALRGIRSLRDSAIPERGTNGNGHNGVDARLVSLLSRIDHGDESARDELIANYPETYAQAVTSNDDVRSEALDEYDTDAEGMADMIRKGDTDLAYSTAKISSLVTITARDYDNRAAHMDAIVEEIDLRNRSFMNSIPF